MSEPYAGVEFEGWHYKAYWYNGQADKGWTPEFALRALPESDEARKHHGGLLVHQDPDPDFYVDKNKYLTKA